MGVEHNGATKKERLAQLQDMLKNRLDYKGKPLPGYKNNVTLVRSEIARLEGEIAKGLK
jgi:hypothetical protein